MTTTTEFTIRPSDGWLQVSTGPTQFLQINPQFKCNWMLYVGTDLPTDGAQANVLVTVEAGLPSDGDVLDIGDETWTFVDPLAATDIPVALSVAETAAEIAGAVSGGAAGSLVTVSGTGALTAQSTDTSALSLSWDTLIVFGAQPDPADTITFAGTTFTFVAASPDPTEILIGASITATRDNTFNRLAALGNARLVKAATNGIYVRPLTDGAATFAVSSTDADIAISWNRFIRVLDIPEVGSTLTLGSTVYDFVEPFGAYDVVIGVDEEETAQNLADAISLASGVVSGQYAPNGEVTVAARAAGVAGNDIEVTTDSAEITLGDTELSGGEDRSIGVGYSYGRGENCFKSDAIISGDAYIRVSDTPETRDACRFSVIAEATTP